MPRLRSLLIVAILLPACAKTPVATAPEAEVCLTNGQKALANDSCDAAVGWLSEAIALDGKNARAYRLRAQAYYRKAETMAPTPTQGYGAEKAIDSPSSLLRSAIDDATKAIELDPRDAEAYLVRARAHARKGGEESRKQAATDCEKALELAADGPVAAEAKKLREELDKP